MPQIEAGKNILIAAHGNSLRALVMQLDGLTREEIIDVNIGTGEPYCYQLDANGAVVHKEILAT